MSVISANHIVYTLGQQTFQLPKQCIQTITHPTTHETTKVGNVHIWLPHPPINIDLRDPDHFELLSNEQLAYFKNNNSQQPNATLFIHGFNVPFGEYGREIICERQAQTSTNTAYQVSMNPEAKAPLQTSKPSERRASFGPNPATIYRNIHHAYNLFGPNIEYLNVTTKNINGSGAHNWWIHMEHNLNKAAGFEGFDYYYNPKKPPYTRLINIAWSGKPANELDYIAIEPVAAKTAFAVVQLIQQLRKKNITVNIIAHSAGNVVLIKAMQQLGVSLHGQHSIQNAFMWEAAIPNTALSPNSDMLDGSFSKFWQTENAHRAANKIFVLYSRHDNVLGPIPIKFTKNYQPDLSLKYQTPGGKLYTKIALSINLIDKLTEKAGVPNAINSAYSLAQMLKVPLSVLLNSQSTRQKLYQQFYTKFHGSQHNIKLAPTLSQQTAIIQQQFPSAFNDLAAFLGSYTAITNDSFLLYLKNIDNQKRLLKLISAANPQRILYIINALAKVASKDFNSTNRHAIHMEIEKRAKKSTGYRYLSHLYHALIKRDPQYIAASTTSSIEYLNHKIHEFIVHLPDDINHFAYQLNQHLYNLIHPTNNPAHNQRQQRANSATTAGIEMATLIITIFNLPGAQPHPAMGYSGPDANDPATQKLIRQGKIIPVDQTDYLFHHSAMRTPSKAVFEKIYQHVIVGEHSYQFGRYRLDATDAS